MSLDGIERLVYAYDSNEGRMNFFYPTYRYYRDNKVHELYTSVTDKDFHRVCLDALIERTEKHGQHIKRYVRFE